jgi:glycosyltransferase involved in cell wall biosynthesis
MAATDVLVHAATAEGVPQVVIQALAAGLPIVATDVIGVREVRDAGVLVGAPDGRDLRDLVREAIEHRPAAVPIVALEPWTVQEVELQIAALHRELGLVS